MTVEELIAKLQKFDGSMTAEIWASNGAMGGNYWCPAVDVFVHKHSDDSVTVVVEGE